MGGIEALYGGDAVVVSSGTIYPQIVGYFKRAFRQEVEIELGNSILILLVIPYSVFIFIAGELFGGFKTGSPLVFEIDELHIPVGREDEADPHLISGYDLLFIQGHPFRLTLHNAFYEQLFGERQAAAGTFYLIEILKILPIEGPPGGVCYRAADRYRSIGRHNIGGLLALLDISTERIVGYRIDRFSAPQQRHGLLIDSQPVVAGR